MLFEVFFYKIFKKYIFCNLSQHLDFERLQNVHNKRTREPNNQRFLWMITDRDLENLTMEIDAKISDHNSTDGTPPKWPYSSRAPPDAHPVSL